MRLAYAEYRDIFLSYVFHVLLSMDDLVMSSHSGYAFIQLSLLRDTEVQRL